MEVLYHTTRNAYDKKFTSICSIIRRYKLLKPTCTSDYYFLNFFFFKQTCNRAQLVPEGWHHLDFINSSAHTHEFRILLQSTVDLQDCCFYNYSKDNRCTYAYHFTLQTVLIKFNMLFHFPLANSIEQCLFYMFTNGHFTWYTTNMANYSESSQ